MNFRSAGEGPALSAFSGLLAVHAHPDDETLSTGGLLAAFAAAGRPVHVVTCTRGERGEVIALPGTTSEGRAGLEGDGPALGAYRETELARALTALADGVDGAIGHSFLDALPGVYAQVNRVVDAGPGAPVGPGPGVVSGSVDGVRYEDSGMTWVAPGVAGPAPDSPSTAFARVPLDESAGRLAALIRECRPAVVATYEPGGGYGHPDHVRAHEMTVRALRLAADPTWEPGSGAGDQEGGVGRRGVPWAGAVQWQAVAPAAEVRAARATLAALPEAVARANAHALALPDPAEDLPPFAKEDLSERSAERQVVGSSDYRSPDGLPITRIGSVARVDVRGLVGWVVAAMRAHATQVQHADALPEAVGPVAGWYALSNGVLAPILTTETYAVADPLR